MHLLALSRIQMQSCLNASEMAKVEFYGFVGNLLFAVLYIYISPFVSSSACWLICYLISSLWQFPFMAAYVIYKELLIRIRIKKRRKKE
jgi:hypothetical protein